MWLNQTTYDVVRSNNHGNSCLPFSPEASIKVPQPFILTKLKNKVQPSERGITEDLKSSYWWCEYLMKCSICLTGNEAPTSRSLISEFIRPLQISGDKPELLSVKPTFLTRSRAGSPARAFLSEVSNSVCLHPRWIWPYLHFSFYKCMDTKTNELSAAQWPSPAVLTEWSWRCGREEASAICIVPPSFYKPNPVISNSRSSSDK